MKIAKYQPEVYELKLSLDVNEKILGRLFHFAACFELRLFATHEKRRSDGTANVQRRGKFRS